MGRFAIEFWGVQAAVEWDDSKFDQAVGNLLLPIWTDDPGLDPEAVFRLKTDNLGQTSVEGPGQDLHPINRADVVETLERRLHLYLATETRQAVFVHAGVVSWQGRTILFPGRSYVGKSTLVQALVRAGTDFFSDEYAIIDPEGMVHPFPRPISLREPEGIRRVDAISLGWDGSLLPMEAGAVIVSRYEEETVWKPEEISRGNAVLELMSNTVSAQGAPNLALTCLGQAVRGVHCYKGSRGESEVTAQRILEHLSTQESNDPWQRTN